MRPPKLVRITTAPISMRLLLAGQPAFMRSKGMEVILVSSPGKDWEGIPDLESYEVHKVQMSRQIDLFRDISALCKMIRLLRRLKPDIVHSHTPKAGMLAMLAAWIARVPVRMHTVAGLPLMERKGLNRKVLVWAEKLTYWCASMVYPNSLRLRAYIEGENFTHRGKLKVIAGGSSNGINTEYFKSSDELMQEGKKIRASNRAGAGDLVFVYIGRIVADKGINELVQAFNTLAGKHASVHLLLVGPFENEQDPISTETKALIDAHERIHNAGFVSDVRPYLCASDVLVFPSYREGFPNVPMQAGCFGLPSIVTNINGCNEIIKQEVNGLIVEPKNVSSLLQAMMQVTENDFLRKKCASSARAYIVERYQQSKIWDALYEEYKEQLFKARC